MTSIDAQLPIRDAATVILYRTAGRGHSVLMGQRGSKAVFMPKKFVFPGGAVDPQDADAPMTAELDADTVARLAQQSTDVSPTALAAAAIRELWEETGLRMGPVASQSTRFAPDPSALRFIFRAITPAGRPRRFDARFFLAPVEAVDGDPDDFRDASTELSHLQWVGLDDARALDLPFITEIVLAEVQAILQAPETPRPVPFFHHDDTRSYFSRL